MRKIFSFVAIAAVVLMMASCGEEPESKDFTFKVQALSENARLFVAPPANNQKDYYWQFVRKNKVEEHGTVRDYVEYVLSFCSYADYKSWGYIRTGDLDCSVYDLETSLSPNTTYVLSACYVENEDDHVKIAGNVEYIEFTTMPAYTLNGEFSVSKTKKVHFWQSNLNKINGLYDAQWKYNGSPDMDLYPWSKTQESNIINSMLTADEWWYLLQTRANAANRFTFATIMENGAIKARGVILLPDVWEKPEDIPMVMPAEMNIAWDGQSKTYRHANLSYDAFPNNKYTPKHWEYLELAGAVFLPAMWNDGRYGSYWSGTAINDEATDAGFIDFDGHALSMLYLKENGDAVTNNNAIRLVAEIK